ncbi:MAG: hypothetical protein GW886_07330 [Rhodobacterales bacterium]|nr:hypothetical protein [Rhodobacterales bacterium]NCT13417.1 hypothetical protein [Rhodobacterales bacterium]
MNISAKLAVAGLMMVASTGAALAERMRVVNNTGVTLYRLYFSEVNDNNWGPDRLGQNVVQSGGAATIDIPGGRNCNWDFLVEYANGVQDQFVVNVCQTGTINLN